MTNLKQEEIGKALIQLFNVRSLIDDGYHNKEIRDLVKVSNTLFKELNDANKEKFQIWYDKKNGGRLGIKSESFVFCVRQRKENKLCLYYVRLDLREMTIQLLTM